MTLEFPTFMMVVAGQWLIDVRDSGQRHWAEILSLHLTHLQKCKPVILIAHPTEARGSKEFLAGLARVQESEGLVDVTDNGNDDQHAQVFISRGFSSQLQRSFITNSVPGFTGGFEAVHSTFICPH